MHEHWIELDAMRVHATTWSTAPARERVLLVHGLGANGVSWLPVAPLLAERLGATVTAVDLVGFGRTGSQEREATIATNGELLRALLQRTGPAVVFGNSMGGALAVWLAARHPELVQALVLVNPAVFDRGRTRAQWTLQARFGPVHLPRAGTLLAARARRLGPTRLVDSALAWCVARPDRVDPEVRRRLIARAAEHRDDAAAGAAYVEAARSLYRYLRHDMTADEARVSCPALVVHGRLDRLVPVEAARSLAARRPAFELVELPDVGHAPQLEAPEAFLDLTVPWVRAALAAGRAGPTSASRQATVTPSSASSARFITTPPP